jgi:hypothetical protein
MLIFFKIFIWLLIGIATAYVAQQKGRDPRIWLFIGLLLGIFGLILVYFLPSVEEKKAESSENEIEIFPLSSTEIEPISDLVPQGYKSKKWFYLTQDRQQIGPLSFQELKDKWVSKSLTEDSYVWCEDMPEWHPLSSLKLFV